MTFLEIVNQVLAKLREPALTATDFDSDTYGQVIKALVNESKREVEDSHTWHTLWERPTPYDVNTGDANIFPTGLFNDPQRGRIIDVWLRETVANGNLQLGRLNPASREYHLRTGQWFGVRDIRGQPSRYSFFLTSTGTEQVSIYPESDADYRIQFTIYNPQEDLSASTDVLKVPHQPVILGAYALAIQERGEDGGMTYQQASQNYSVALGDLIALSARNHFDSRAFDWVTE